MLTFPKFKKLPADIQSIAVKFWVGELMNDISAKTIKEIPTNLVARIPQRCLGTSLYGKRTNESLLKYGANFWYEKYNGRRFKNDKQIARLEEMAPGHTKSLLHPLWKYLTKREWSKIELLEFAFLLPPLYRDKILNTEQCSFKKQFALPKLKQGLLLDNLLAYLLWGLANFHQEQNELYGVIRHPVLNNQFVLAILSHFALMNQHYESGFKLIQLLLLKFTIEWSLVPPPKQPVILRASIRNKNLKLMSNNLIPLQLEGFKDVSHFKQTCCLAKEVAAFAKVKLSTINTLKQQQSFLRSIEVKHFTELILQLEAHSPQDAVPSNSLLGKMQKRIKTQI